jgi:hypothetical protein
MAYEISFMTANDVAAQVGYRMTSVRGAERSR